MVLGFAHAGADVIVSRAASRTRATASPTEMAALGRRCRGYACHMARWADIDRLVERVYGDFGRVDILVNNAGISPLYADTASVTEELWDKVLGVNLKGPFRLTALVGSRMAAGGQRLDHQHQQHRLVAAEQAVTIHGGQGRPQHARRGLR